MSRNFLDHSTASELMKRHERPRVLALWGLLSVCSGIGLVLVFQALVLGFLWGNPEHPDPEGAAFDIVRTRIFALPGVGGGLSKTGETTGFFDIARDAPNSFFFCLAYVIGLVTLFPMARNGYRRFLIPFDRRVFAAIRQPKAFDPLRPAPIDFESDSVMPWTLPEDGPRLEIWQALKTFIQCSEQAFEWALLLGRPGSGKTRIAVEFARGPLARTDLFGDTSTCPEATKLKRIANWWEVQICRRIATWWRVQVCRNPCKDYDFWDVGWIRPEKFDARAKPGELAVSIMLGEIKQWRPRRPTFILLDDPLPADAKQVLVTLSEIKKEFSHIVRLLIVNQSVPVDLQLKRKSQTGDWHSTLMSPAIQPIIVSGNNAFTARDIRAIRFQLLPLGKYLVSQDEGVDAFLRMTRGNPLLVEIGFDWMRSHEGFAEMSEHTLLAFRVKKILKSVETAGFDENDENMKHCMVVATICGGEGASRTLLKKTMGFSLSDSTKLARLFPADDVDLNVTVPSVRPEMIGFAFVREVLSGVSMEDAKRLIDVAWQCNPRGTLRTVLLTDRRGRIEHTDVLSELLLAPPEAIDMPSFDLFQAYAEAACVISRADWNERSYHIGRGLESSALVIANRLETADRLKALDYLLGLLATSREDGVIRWSALNELAVGVITGAVESKAFENLEAFLGRLSQWVDLSPTYCGKQNLPEIPKDLLAHAFISEIRESRENVTSSLMGFVKSVTGQDGNSTVRASTLFTGVNLVELVRKEGFQSDMAKREDVLHSMGWMALAQLATLSLKDEREGLIERAAAIQQLPLASELCKVRAWRYVAYAQREDRAACEGTAMHVAKIAEPFLPNPAFELECTKALSFVVNT